MPYKTVVESFKSKSVTFKQAKLTRIRGDGKFIHVELPETGDKEFIPYDVLCVCTGSSYVSPWRAHDESMANLDDRREEFETVRRNVRNNKSILCVGGGPTGVQTAAYIKETMPYKTVGICQRGEKLLPHLNGAHDIASRLLN